jgi:MFS superfamily sulfate permease-like transporter
LSKKGKIFQLIQGPLVAVIIGIIYVVFTKGNNYWAIQSELLVSVPVPEDMNSFFGQFTFPNFQGITRVEIWITAFTIALVASLETLLCVEATDKLDPDKRITPTNRELIAQGTGNFISGLIGGLPVTQVIVRSSANIQSGGKTKMSAIIHGFFLLISILLIPALLNQIPLSVLAAILFIVGYKLAKPSLFVTMYKLGWKQLLPFLITIIGIVFTDLLIGIGLGLILGIVIILINSFQNSHSILTEGKNKTIITLAEEVTFFNKASILKELDKLPEATSLEIDLRGSKFIDNDIIEIFEDFLAKQKNKNFEFKIISSKGEYKNPENLAELFYD